jgi:hypothetical protein
VVVLAWAPSAFAQGTASANITAEATVLASVAVANQRDLQFGNVIPGTDKSVTLTDATSGRWLVTGGANAEVTLTFTSLPGVLNDGGSNDLPIVYAVTDAGHNTTNDPGTASVFNPAAGSTANIGDPVAELYVWIGGTVVPDPAQAPGLYTGTITLEATYTGN